MIIVKIIAYSGMSIAILIELYVLYMFVIAVLPAAAQGKTEPTACILIRMDKYNPLKLIARAEHVFPRVETRCYPIDHFDIYLADHLRQALDDQLAFFEKHLN